MKSHSERCERGSSQVLKGLFLIIALGCLPSGLAQRPAQGPMSPVRQTPEEMGYELVWQDDFNGNALDPKKWEVRGIGPRALGFVAPEAVTVEGGYLNLHALRKNGRILLGAVGTQNRFMTRYGYYASLAESVGKRWGQGHEKWPFFRRKWPEDACRHVVTTRPALADAAAIHGPMRKTHHFPRPARRCAIVAHLGGSVRSLLEGHSGPQILL